MKATVKAPQERVEQIQKAAERAAGLTRQLLAFSRKQVLQPRILDLNEVVADVARMLRRLIGEDIQLVVTPAGQLRCIQADPGQLEQVLAHIFEPFFSTKEEGKGTGLGLATVFGIVQQSGGSISVDSQLGAGTTCRIYFPRVEDDLKHPPQAAPGVPLARGTETVLLVEDADPLRVMIREILESAGYTVLESSDPVEALRRVSSPDVPVRLMLTDVVMPGMSGRDLAKKVRVARPEIKVLFMSGYTDEAMGLHVLDAGTRFIQKPFATDALLRKVREALDEP